MTDARIRILCVDDHVTVRKGLTAILDQEPDMHVVADVATGPEGIAEYRRQKPDITLMDLQLPGMSGFDAIRAICKEDPNARIIALTMFRGEADVRRALDAGATAYLLKNSRASELVETIRIVNSGGQLPPPSAITRNPTGMPLTSREEQVIQLLAQGRATKEIAAALNISHATAEAHLKNIFVKLGVHDRTEAVVAAVRLGIVHLDQG